MTGALVVCAGLIVEFQPALVPATLSLVGQRTLCSVGEIYHGSKKTYELFELTGRYRTESRVIQREGACELWEMPRGKFWMPVDNGGPLPLLLAQQTAGDYGPVPEGGPCSMVARMSATTPEPPWRRVRA